MLLRLERKILDETVEQLPSHLMVVHAGALRVQDELLVFYGGPGAGKTTVVDTLLVGDGTSFVTDELVIIDSDERRVLPFPRPLAYEPIGPSPRADTLLELTDEGQTYRYGLPSPDKIEQDLFQWNRCWFLGLKRSNGPADISPCSTGQGLLALFPHLFRPDTPAAKHKALGALGRTNQYIDFNQLHYEEAADLSEAILARAGASS